ncbi:MAG TPA: type IX secretion system membrane protein PorP/SprF [Bacteroidia bacterium]
MKKLYTLLMFTCCMSTLTTVMAQDPVFTQFYANPLYLNPAFAGSNVCPRICINYRNQWPGITGTYVTTSASFDRFVYRIKSGIGVLVTNDQAGQGTLKTTNVSGIYSYQWRPTRKLSINVGFKATYGQKSLDWSKLTFGDQIDDKRGFVYNSNEMPGVSSKSFVDFSAGFVAFTKHFYGGFAADHLTQPDESLLSGGQSRLPMKFTGHAGAVIPVGDKQSETSISPNILYQQQQDFKQLNLGVYFTKGVLVGGLWYRNSDAFIVLLGVQKGAFKIGYSYDVTVSKLTNATAGSHELSLGLQLNCKKPKPRYRPLDCPSF